jgi:hypothetical protein
MERNNELLIDAPHEELLPDHIASSSEIPEVDDYSIHDLKTLLAWSAPGRPFQRKSKEYFLNILIIMLLIEVILFLFSQYILMVLIIAFVFLIYALNTVAPHDFHYKVTSEGLMVEDHFFLWQELYDFYFKNQNGVTILIVGTKAWYPGELTLVLGSMHQEQVRDALLHFLPYREYVKPTFMEKSAGWLEKNFPLERHQ